MEHKPRRNAWLYGRNSAFKNLRYFLLLSSIEVDRVIILNLKSKSIILPVGLLARKIISINYVLPILVALLQYLIRCQQTPCLTHHSQYYYSAPNSC